MPIISRWPKRRHSRSSHNGWLLRTVTAIYSGLAVVALHLPTFAADHDIDEEITVVGSQAEARGLSLIHI